MHGRKGSGEGCRLPRATTRWDSKRPRQTGEDAPLLQLDEAGFMATLPASVGVCFGHAGSIWCCSAVLRPDGRCCAFNCARRPLPVGDADCKRGCFFSPSRRRRAPSPTPCKHSRNALARARAPKTGCLASSRRRDFSGFGRDPLSFLSLVVLCFVLRRWHWNFLPRSTPPFRCPCWRRFVL